MRKTLKVEKWNQNEVRFVWHNDEWWAVAKDVAKALGYSHTPHMVRRMDEDEKSSVRLVDSTSGGNPNVTIISEDGQKGRHDTGNVAGSATDQNTTQSKGEWKYGSPTVRPA